MGLLHGELGDPYGGWSEPLFTTVLAGCAPAKSIRQLASDDEVPEPWPVLSVKPR